jgi:dolichol-phosphate mannosyltransferase
MTVSRPLVVVPTYNESENIVDLLDQVLKAAPQVDVLVVDDSSPDHTGDLVASHPGFGDQVHLLTRPGKAGIGAAYRAGFTWGLERDYDAVVQMDADFSHPPERLPALIEALEDYDVAIGSRYVHGGGIENWALSRRLISSVGNVYVATVLGLPVRDATAGFKAFRSTALAKIGAVSSESNGYCFQIENTWQASREGLSVVEVPITFTDRTRGESKMSSAIVLEAIIRVLGWRWRGRGFLRRRSAR